MKKVYVLFLYIIILFLLTGCYSGLKSETAKGNQKQETKNIFYIKPDKTELQKLLYKAKKIDKNKFTTKSAKKLKIVIFSVTQTINNQISTQNDINIAYKTLQSAVDNMVKATKGIYQINCSLDCISINHVGDDWIEEITYNEKSIEDGDIIIASLKDDITIIGKVIENDNIPDYGSSSVTISVSGGEKTTQFYVKENR